MSALDKLDASLVVLARLIATNTEGQIRTDFVQTFEDISLGIGKLRSELTTPVFPESYPDPGEKTLRDEFAMAAPPMPTWYGVEDCMIASVDWRYAYADAMLAARAAPP